MSQRNMASVLVGRTHPSRLNYGMCVRMYLESQAVVAESQVLRWQETRQEHVDSCTEAKLEPMSNRHADAVERGDVTQICKEAGVTDLHGHRMAW